MIDLHSHSNQSDGTDSPEQLVRDAKTLGIHTLAITDHDTFAGYDIALPEAHRLGIRLVCGIELSVKLHGHSIHLLGYFSDDARMADFRRWVLQLQASRQDRNAALVQRLQTLGLNITLAEVRALSHGVVGRPHFAQILVRKHYVKTIQQAFDDYLSESAPAYVDRIEAQFDEATQRIRASGGIASLAHPNRIKHDLTLILPEMCAAGLNGIEAYHSDHGTAETERFIDLARQHALFLTGGSDFHGTVKPGIKLGTGRDGTLRIPGDLVERWLGEKTGSTSR